jgi:hypothetical protein
MRKPEVKRMGFAFSLVISLLVLFASGCSTTPSYTPAVTTAPSAAATTIPAASPTPTISITPPRNIILVGWDGAQRNHVKESLSRGELPNLEKLSAEGALVAIDIYRVTDTKAGWSQILTGYEPEVTGVFSNGNYQPIRSEEHTSELQSLS